MKRVVELLTHPGLCLLFRRALGGVFLFAAWPKVICPEAFSVAVAAYRIGPDAWINLAAVTLPWVELAAALGLLVGWRVRAFALLHIGLELFFIAMIVAAIVAGVTQASCGCEVPGFSEEFGWSTVLRDVLFIALAAHVALFDRRGYSIDGLLARRT